MLIVAAAALLALVALLVAGWVEGGAKPPREIVEPVRPETAR